MAVAVSRTIGRLLLCPKHRVLVVPAANKVWEPDRKGGYNTKIDKKKIDMLKEGWTMLPGEMSKFKDEVVERFRMDSFIHIEPGDYETLWKFDNKETMDEWIVTSDRDHQEGKSKAELLLSQKRTAMFQGYLNTDVPKDGVVKTSGYCNIRSPKNYISFQRQRPYDWSRYTHLLMRVRGDGRPYQLCLAMDCYYDIQWNDMYNYSLFTKGGPYWQIAKIPFSKFILSHKGRVQDKQETVVKQLDKISHMGITLGDSAKGPFQLEIDYIALVYDANHTEEFAYEMYKVSPYVHC